MPAFGSWNLKIFLNLKAAALMQNITHSFLLGIILDKLNIHLYNIPTNQSLEFPLFLSTIFSAAFGTN